MAIRKAHGVNEQAWLEDVLRRMPKYELGKKSLGDLLPAKWTAAIVTKKPNRHRTQHQKNATDIPLVSVALQLW